MIKNLVIHYGGSRPRDATRLTLNSIAAAAKAQMPDVARLELVRGNGYFYVVGEWKKKNKYGQPFPITSGGIYTNRIGEDNKNFDALGFWLRSIKDVVERERPSNYADL